MAPITLRRTSRRGIRCGPRHVAARGLALGWLWTGFLTVASAHDACDLPSRRCADRGDPPNIEISPFLVGPQRKMPGARVGKWVNAVLTLINQHELFRAVDPD